MPKKTPPEMYQRFLAVLSDMAGAYRISTDPDVAHAVLLLEKALQRRIFNNEHPIKKRVTPRPTFIAIFKRRYSILEDLDYGSRIGAEKHRMIEQFIEMLKEIGVETDDYLEWMFEEFLGTRLGGGMRPTSLGYIISASAFAQYWSKNKDRVKKNQAAKLLAAEERDLLNRSRVIARESDKKSFLDWAKKYRDGAIMIEEFRARVIEAEQQLNLR